MAKRIILAYSGGLDTSWCIPHLIGEGWEVITVTVDVGGMSDAEREDLAERAQKLGAISHHFVDARAAFYATTLRFLIAGNVRRGGVYPLCVGAERFLQAQMVAEFANQAGALAIGHGCTAAGNDQVRFETALRALAPGMEIVAPIRDLTPSRSQQVEDLQRLGMPVPKHGAAYSINSGLWGVTIGGTETTTSDGQVPEHAWVRTQGAYANPKAPTKITLTFKEGQPTHVDGVAMEPVALIEHVDTLAASYGIGRGVHLGDTVLGVKGRVAFEAPAATVLIESHRELEKLVLTGRQQRIKDSLAGPYGDWVHEGQLLDPVCRDIEALFLQSQERVTGVVHVLMRPGSLFIEGVESPYSLMAASKGVYGEAVGEWTAADALGFSRIVGLPGVFHRRAGVRAAEQAKAK